MFWAQITGYNTRWIINIKNLPHLQQVFFVAISLFADDRLVLLPFISQTPG
jgi:hypothetical protein